MLKNCYFCKKLVRSINIYSNQSRTISNRKKKIRIVGVRFKHSPLITNRRRFSINKIPTRVICKMCKSKDKKQKPLDYLMKALSNTINESYDIEVDTEFCPDENLGAHNDIDNELITSRDDVVTFDEENPYDLMTEEETLFWGGAVHTLENIAVQQGILRELYDSAPEDIVHQPELLREFFENVPEQLAERQRLMQGRDENIPDLLADQQRLLRAVEEPIENEQRFLQKGDIPQNLAVQHGLAADDVRQPQQIEAIRKLLPQGENLVIGQIAIQQRLRVGDENPPDMNVLHQRRGVGDINLPGQMILEQKDNNVLEQILYHRGMFRVASIIVSKQLALHLGIRIGNSKVPNSFTVHQKLFSEDDNIPDMLNVHRTLLQEDDHVQESNENSQEPIIDQQAYFHDEEDDSDVLDLLSVWQRLSLNETLPRLISLERQVLSESENSIICQGLPQLVENNIPEQYATSQSLCSDTSILQKQIEINYELRSKVDNKDVNDQLAIDQELLNKGHNTAQKPFVEQQKSLRQTYESNNDPQEPIDVQQKTLHEEDNNILSLTGETRLSADNCKQQEQIAMHQKIPPDDNYSIKNQVTSYQEFLPESTEEVQEDNLYQQRFLCESDSNSIQEFNKDLVRLSAGNCKLQHITSNLQLLSGNNNNVQLGIQQEVQQVDNDKAKEPIDNQSESMNKFKNNVLESPTVQQEITADDKNRSELNAICHKLTPVENFPSQDDIQPIKARQKYFFVGTNNALKLAGQIKVNIDDSNMYEGKAIHQKSQSNNDNSSSDQVTAHQKLPKESNYKEHEVMVEQQSFLREDNNNYQFVNSTQNNITKERLKQQPILKIAGIPSPDIELQELPVDKSEQIKGLKRLLRVSVENVSIENNKKIVDGFSEQIKLVGKRVKEIEEDKAKVRKMSVEDSIATRRVEESLL